MKIRHVMPLFTRCVDVFAAHLPQFCCFCHQKTDTSYDVCRYCRLFLPAIIDKSGQKPPTSVCLQCGFVWPDDENRSECAQCVNYRTIFDRIICPFRYDFPVDGLIARLKYKMHLPTGRLLGALLAEEIGTKLVQNEFPDVILPVPLNNARYRSRGFNQAEEISRWCGRALQIPVQPFSIGRRHDTGALVGLTRAERELRIRGAFWADRNLSGLSVALVDDVMTTGATAGELATELIDQGVRSVQLWVVARTPLITEAASS